MAPKARPQEGLQTTNYNWPPPLEDPITKSYERFESGNLSPYTELFQTLENKWLCPEPHMTRDHALWDVSESLGYVKVDSEQLKFLKACNPEYNDLTPGVALLANSALADKCTHKCQENGEEKGCKVNRVETYPVGDRTYGVAQQWYPHMCDPEKNEGFVHLKSLLSWDNYKARVKKSNQDRTMTNQWTWACFGCSINPKEPVSLDWAKYAHANLDHRRKKMDQYMIVDFGPLGYRICWINEFERAKDTNTDLRGYECRNLNWGEGPYKDQGPCKFHYGTIPNFDASGNLVWPTQQPKENHQGVLIEAVVHEFEQKGPTEAPVAGPSESSSMPAVTTSMPADPGAPTSSATSSPARARARAWEL
jgi:hypothetical protein